MKAMTFDKSFAEKKDTFANLIANLSRMVLTTSERLFYIKTPYTGFSINSHVSYGTPKWWE